MGRARRAAGPPVVNPSGVKSLPRRGTACLRAVLRGNSWNFALTSSVTPGPVAAPSKRGPQRDWSGHTEPASPATPARLTVGPRPETRELRAAVYRFTIGGQFYHPPACNEQRLQPHPPGVVYPGP